MLNEFSVVLALFSAALVLKTLLVLKLTLVSTLLRCLLVAVTDLWWNVKELVFRLLAYS